jgi:hypothetical protein
MNHQIHVVEWPSFNQKDLGRAFPSLHSPAASSTSSLRVSENICQRIQLVAFQTTDNLTQQSIADAHIGAFHVGTSISSPQL